MQTAIIKDIKITESDGDGDIQATLNLEERDPQVKKVQEQQQTTPPTTTDTAPTSTQDIVLSPNDQQLLAGVPN